MGFCLTWLKIAKRSHDDILDLLGVVPTGEDATDFHDGLSGRLETDGSYLFVAWNDGAHYLDPRRLASLSAGGDVVACHVHEGSMTSFSSGWSDGHEMWHVAHESAPDGPKLDVVGSPPDRLFEIRRLKEKAQRAELSRPRMTPVNQPSDLPPDLLEFLTGSGSVTTTIPMTLSMGVNHIFDVPVALCEALVGFRHDRACSWQNGPFEILAPKA